MDNPAHIPPKKPVELPPALQPIANVPPGNEWNPPAPGRDVAILYPERYKQTKIEWDDNNWDYELNLPALPIDGLDGCYILSSDGTTRPYGEGH